MSADEWETLQGRLDKLGDRIDARIDKVTERMDGDRKQVAYDITEAQKAMGAAFKDHKDEYHNPAKTWGILSAVVGVVVGVVEFVKYMFMERKG